jgi:hypothetical protein
MQRKREAWHEHMWREFDMWEGGELTLEPGPMPDWMREAIPEAAEVAELADLGEIPLPGDPPGEPDLEPLPLEAYEGGPREAWRVVPEEELWQELQEEEEWRREVGAPQIFRNPPANRLGWGVLAWVVGGYLWDDWIRPELWGAVARGQAHARGLPLLSVGVGSPATSFRAFVLGPGPWGDVNVDLVPSPGVVGANVERLPFPDGRFGAAIAAHVLEHVQSPQIALSELRRVTRGPIYVLTPCGVWAHTWGHPGHRWFRASGGDWIPLWQ